MLTDADPHRVVRLDGLDGRGAVVRAVVRDRLRNKAVLATRCRLLAGQTESATA